MQVRCTLPYAREGKRHVIGTDVYTFGPKCVLLPQPANAAEIVVKFPRDFEWFDDAEADAAVEAQRLADAAARDPKVKALQALRALSEDDLNAVLSEFIGASEPADVAPAADPITTPAVGSAPAASADGYRPKRHKGAR